MDRLSVYNIYTICIFGLNKVMCAEYKLVHMHVSSHKYHNVGQQVNQQKHVSNSLKELWKNIETLVNNSSYLEYSSYRKCLIQPLRVLTISKSAIGGSW